MCALALVEATRYGSERCLSAEWISLSSDGRAATWIVTQPARTIRLRPCCEEHFYDVVISFVGSDCQGAPKPTRSLVRVNARVEQRPHIGDVAAFHRIEESFRHRWDGAILSRSLQWERRNTSAPCHHSLDR
jgi:hypothetical protein